MDSAHPHTVLSKLNEQRSQGLFCDVTIVVEDVKFRAHKNILAACSGYFRNALTTPEIWSSGQVLELMDLKSEVFASILNFIYCSKVSPPAAEDTGGLVAAGKRLGIPFLEKLAEQERLDSGVSPNLPQGAKAAADGGAAPASRTAKKEVSKQEEVDGARGPRITNAFSITEVCPGSNPFTPLLQASGRRQSADAGQLPASAPCLGGNNETTHTLSEHSYAVNQASEDKDNAQRDDKKLCKPPLAQPKQLMYRNAGPLKKRHRLRGAVGRNLLSAPSESAADQANGEAPEPAQGQAVAVAPPAVAAPPPAVAAAAAAAATPPPLFSEAETEGQTDGGLPPAADSVGMELSPPTLSPHPEDSISIFGCEHCPEIFTNKALLTIHSEVHKKRFVSHLFCKFCHRKFIHLKRLRNHEQVCPKAARGPPLPDEATPEEDVHSGGESEPDDADAKPPSVDPPLSHGPGPLPGGQSERPPGERMPHAAGGGGGQRRYNCSVCKRVYVTLSSLKRHENVHSWQRAYPCHYCNKVFALAEYRTKHEIWHTGERRYQCIFCLETFMTYYILKNHQKSFHGIDPTLAVKKKSANGGLKASVYPIKLYRLLPMKFRKRQYKTYSHTYADAGERGEAVLESGALIPPFEGNALLSPAAAAAAADSVSLPLTFMATTKMVAPVTPCISVEKPCQNDVGENPDAAPEERELRGARRDGGLRAPAFVVGEGTFALQPDPPRDKDHPLGLIDPHHLAPDVTFFNSLNTVKKLGELSASAKRVEDMTKELLQSSADNLALDKTSGTKTETYIAKPACPGPSADGGAMPLCQITVKIGNEAIIRRRIKGSKLFPRKKRRIREEREAESPPLLGRDASQSPRLRLRAELAKDPYEDPNDCDTADKLWRPYYSYKAKKKRKKLRFKHRQALFHLYPDGEGEAKPDPRRAEEGAEPKRLGRTAGPRTTYSCDICHSSFITETGLRAHVIGSHPCFCRTCGEQGPPGEAPAGDYVCNACMESGSCFDNSKRSSNPEKRYRCSFCPQRFLYLATKRSHEKKHQAAPDAYGYDAFRSKYLSQMGQDGKDSFKTEELDNHDGGGGGGGQVKAESVKGEYFPLEKPKVEDTSDFVSLNPFQDISYSHMKRPSSPAADSLFSLHPLKVKHKMAKKRMGAEHSMQLGSGLTSDRDAEGGQRSNLLHDPKIFRRSEADSKGELASLHRSERRLCKEEPFF